jgi:iron complex outermembrane receptor protein
VKLPNRSFATKRLPTALACILAAAPGLAHSNITLALAPDLAELSLEQLTNVTVTSASRRAERLIEAPASIFVVTANDIRRSGAVTLADALRLAPNLNIAAIDNGQLAVSARGFNGTVANKLLVLIDGRTVYTPLFSGVFWDVQDVMLEDIERIEVISGPAATLWGSNGVNGVINITTLGARATQGSLASGFAGDRAKGAALRHGGALGGDAHYRVYAKYTELDANRLATGASARDEQQRSQAGFRIDWQQLAGGSFTLQGDAYRGDGNNLTGLRDFSGSNLLGRWESRGADDSVTRLQAYYDRTEREHARTFGETLDLFDIEFQRGSKPRPGHMLLWGGGYRFARDEVRNSPSLAFLPANKDLRWGNVFVQDEVELRPDLQLTLGIKVETNPYSGHEWLPNARLGWQASDDHLIWAALSRAVRAPSRLDRELFAPGQAPFFVLTGNESFQSEVANVAELGYRAQLTKSASLSLTAFHHRFPNLRSVEPTTAGPTIANGIEGRLNGLEGWGSFRATPTLLLTGGFVVMDNNLKLRPGAVDTGGFGALGNDPKRTAMLRASWDFSARHDLDVTMRHVGALPDPAVPAYTVLDARLGWHVSKSLELALGVRNATDRKYAEFGSLAARAVFERAVFFKAIWKLS